MPMQRSKRTCGMVSIVFYDRLSPIIIASTRRRGWGLLSKCKTFV